MIKARVDRAGEGERNVKIGLSRSLKQIRHESDIDKLKLRQRVTHFVLWILNAFPFRKRLTVEPDKAE